MSISENSFHFRKPEKKDAYPIYTQVKNSPPLELNTYYAYLLITTHFRDTSVVAADIDDRVLGFIAGYRIPCRMDTLFIWQVCTDKSMRGKGLAKKMVYHIMNREENNDIWFIEATVTPSNIDSNIFFKSLATFFQCEFSCKDYFKKEDFAPLNHEEEVLYRIGPIKKG
jgi:L-2,4-diaminobutyric acid acetyltransferase